MQGAHRLPKRRALASPTTIVQHPTKEPLASSFELQANVREGCKKFPIIRMQALGNIAAVPVASIAEAWFN
jgi:hypothetical protein